MILPAVSKAPSSPPAAFQRAVFAGFVGNGIFTVILGPILPTLSARWGLTDSQAGFFFTAQFVGAVLGVTAYGLLARRLGYRGVLVLGYALMGTGVAFLSAPIHRLALLGMFGAGCGYGMVTPASNLVVAAVEPGRRAALLNLLNFTWGIGAVSCPFLVAFATRLHHLSVFLLSLTALLAAFAVTFLLLEGPRVPGESSGAARARGKMSPQLVVSLALFVCLFFLYVGTENSFGGWAATMAHQLSGMDGGVAALMPSFFWALLLLGRLSAPVMLRMLSERTLALACLSLGLLSSLLLVGVKSATGLAVTIAIGGLGCSTIFPILVAWLTKFVDESVAGWRSLPFGAASFGGAILPWLVGVLSTRFGGLRAGFPLVSLAIGGMILLVLLLHRGEGPAPGRSGNG